jgi:hypothetical protein
MILTGAVVASDAILGEELRVVERGRELHEAAVSILEGRDSDGLWPVDASAMRRGEWEEWWARANAFYGGWTLLARGGNRKKKSLVNVDVY